MPGPWCPLQGDANVWVHVRHRTGIPRRHCPPPGAAGRARPSLHGGRRGVLPRACGRARRSAAHVARDAQPRRGQHRSAPRTPGEARDARHLLHAGTGRRAASPPGPANRRGGTRSGVARSWAPARGAHECGDVPGRPAPLGADARGHHRAARPGLPRAGLLDRARHRVGIRRPSRGRIGLRLEPLPHSSARLELSRMHAGAALHRPRGRGAARAAARHDRDRRHAAAGRGRGVAASPAIRPGAARVRNSS